MSTGSYSSTPSDSASTSSTSSPIPGLITTLAVPLVFIIGVIVLIALHDVTSAVGVPLIVALAGVHTGSALTNASGNSTS